MTSHDVVMQVRRALGERRVGHAGTLDPLASGVMVVGVGQATRLLGRLTQDRKAYVARILFGAETATDDAEGEVTRRAAVSAELGDAACAQELLARFLGPQLQVPPAFSAISVNGVRAYRRARAGEDVALEARPIEVFDAQLISLEEDEGVLTWTVAFVVSKGTYVRALARDLGRAAGSAAHLGALVRTASGTVVRSRCLALDELDGERVRAAALDPVAILELPSLALDGRSLERVRNGAPLELDDEVLMGARDAGAADGDVALVREGLLVALARREGRRLVMEEVFPQGIEGVA